MCGSRERFANARKRHRLGRVARTDDADRARAFAGAQDLAPRDERAEDDVGEVGPRAHQLPEASRAGSTSTRPGCEMRAVRNARCPVRRFSSPRKRCSPCVATTTSPAVVEADDLDLTFEHDEEVGRRVAGAVQDLAAARRRGSRRTAASSSSVRSSSSGHAASACAAARSIGSVSLIAVATIGVVAFAWRRAPSSPRSFPLASRAPARSRVASDRT